MTADAVANAGSPLIGSWRNQLGSTMEITDASDGILVGRYNSAVGEAENFYPLRGTYDKNGTESGGTIGWAVSFRNDLSDNELKSTCVWSGQRQKDANDKPVINTTWVLTKYTEADESWSCTRTNKDYFSKVEPIPLDEKKE